jgi:hypothetical protein
MNDKKSDSSIQILVAIIGATAVCIAATISVLQPMVSRWVDNNFPTNTPLAFTPISAPNNISTEIPTSVSFIPSLASATPMPSMTPQAVIPPTLPAQYFSYGVLGQGQRQTTLTSPGVCALYFYPFGGQEKTFVFKSENQISVQNYNGTLSCWQNMPSLADVGTNHPFAPYDEVQQAGVIFSGQISYIDPSTLK